MRVLRVLAALAVASSPAFADDARVPTRIVSLNPCIDTVLVELAPRAHIAAISHYSRDPVRSIIADLAKTLPVTYESAEEVVALEPDLVLAGRHSALATRNALKRVGIRFELFSVPVSMEASHAQIRRVAALLQQPERGEQLIARIDAAIAAARPAANTPRLTAAVYQPGGLTAGTDTITDDLLRVVGLDNLAARHGVTMHQPWPLERLLHAAPQILLVSDPRGGGSMHAERVVQHRALRALAGRMQPAAYPVRYLYCAGPTMIPALTALTAARDRALASPQP
jgi:iron complex transport system substrate-binding protein